MIVKFCVTFLVISSIKGAVVPKKEADFGEKVAVIVPQNVTEQLNVTTTTESVITVNLAENSTTVNLEKTENHTTETTPLVSNEIITLPPFKNIPKDTIPTLEEFLSGDFWNSPPFSIIASDDLENLSKSDGTGEVDAKKIMEGKNF